MLRLDLQFYAFFMVVLCGALLGLLFDLLRFVVRQCRLNRVLTAAADILFWIVATTALSGALFYGNWGEIRLYVLVGLLLGLFLYYTLASAVVMAIADLLFRILMWVIDLLLTVWLRLIWGPLVAVALLLWRIVGLLTSGLERMGYPLYRLGRRLYRCMKYRYLITKRKWRRRFRR